MPVCNATKKREDTNGTITELFILESGKWETKSTIIGNIEGPSKYAYYTKPPTGKGAPIRVIAHKYLRSDANDTLKDNIDELPLG